MRPNADRTAVIADPYPLWCDALETLLGGLGVGVVGRAANVDEVVQMVERHRPDLLVGDYALLAGKAGDELRELRNASPDTRFVVLSEQSDESERDLAFARGAWAYCAKQVEPDDLVATIRQLFEPSIYFADTLPRSPERDSQSAGDLATLTKRELEVLRLAAEGHSNSQLARMLWVTEQTVKFHLSNIYRKLSVANRTEASHWALVHGLIGEDAAIGAA